MQYTVAGFTWEGETVANPKPDYMKELNESRAIGLLDINYDGKIAKTELRGRAGKTVLASFDKFDANKDGILNKEESAGLMPLLNQRVARAENER